MWINGRRVVIRAWHSAREQFAALVAERDMLKVENDTLKRQFERLLHELRGVTDELRALRMAVLARQKAGDALAALYRTRAIQQAERAERDPALPLQ